MKSALRKVKRLQPLVKAKKAQLDREAATLAMIRAEVSAARQALEESQQRYQDGVENLNKIRSSANRQHLDVQEQSLDYIKSEWYRFYRQVQAVQQKEQAQLVQLRTAHNELKAAERLVEKYDLDLRKGFEKSEQKELDDVSARRFTS